MKAFVHGATAALFALAPAAGNAATVFVNATYDLSNLSDYQAGFDLIFQQLENPPVVLQEDDDVIFSLDFLGDQTLIINDPSHLSAQLFDTVGVDPNFRASGGWEFYNPSSNLNAQSIVDQFGPFDTEGFGAFAVAGRQIIGPGPIEFSGFTVSLRVMDLLPDGAHTYQRSGFRFGSGSGSFEVGQIEAVPEPSTWMMLLTGFAAVGYSLRRRRSRGQAEAA